MSKQIKPTQKVKIERSTIKKEMKKLNSAFKELRELGFFAKQNFWCCSTCAVNAIPDNTENYVFYHQQDTNMLNKTGGVYLGWAGDGNKIIEVMKRNDIKVDWDGDERHRIYIDLL